MVTKQDHFDRFIRILRITGFCLGLVNIALGIYELITSNLNPRSAINAIYSILFGMLMIICEVRWVKVLKHFYFLQLFLGLGAFYIFVGGIAIGGAWYQYAVGGVSIGVGLIYFTLGLLCRKMGKENFRQSGLRTASEQAPLPPSSPSAPKSYDNVAPGGPVEGVPDNSRNASPYGDAYSNESAYSNNAYAEPAAIKAAKRSAYEHDPEMA